MTALGGLPPFLDLLHAAKIPESIERNIHLRENGQGWAPAQLIIAGVLVNLSGGDAVDDLEVLNADEGFGKVRRRVECCGMTRRARQEMERRFRKGRERNVPSPPPMHRFLLEFHDPAQEELRQRLAALAATDRPEAGGSRACRGPGEADGAGRHRCCLPRCGEG